MTRPGERFSREIDFYADLRFVCNVIIFDAPAKASPYTGEVAKIFNFCRRGCIGEFVLFALAFSGLISLFCTILQSKIKDF